MRKRIELSDNAKQDVKDIYAFGLYRFGKDQAVKYREELFEFFSLISDYPYSYPIYKHPVRKAVHKPHTVFYIYDNGLVRIINIIDNKEINTLHN